MGSEVEDSVLTHPGPPRCFHFWGTRFFFHTTSPHATRFKPCLPHDTRAGQRRWGSASRRDDDRHLGVPCSSIWFCCAGAPEEKWKSWSRPHPAQGKKVQKLNMAGGFWLPVRHLTMMIIMRCPGTGQTVCCSCLLLLLSSSSSSLLFLLFIRCCSCDVIIITKGTTMTMWRPGNGQTRGVSREETTTSNRHVRATSVMSENSLGPSLSLDRCGSPHRSGRGTPPRTARNVWELSGRSFAMGSSLSLDRCGSPHRSGRCAFARTGTAEQPVESLLSLQRAHAATKTFQPRQDTDGLARKRNLSNVWELAGWVSAIDFR